MYGPLSYQFCEVHGVRLGVCLDHHCIEREEQKRQLESGIQYEEVQNAVDFVASLVTA